jgi:hypothetical protein
MANQAPRKFLLVVVALALALLNVDLVGAQTQTQSTSQPAKVREVDFIYHPEITEISPNARRVEAWILLPRNRFQQLSRLTVGSPAYVEVIEQPIGGNRVAHLSAAAPAS